MARLYVRDCDAVLTEQEKNLRAIFEFYSLGDDQEGKSAAGRRMNLQEWECPNPNPNRNPNPSPNSSTSFRVKCGLS